MPRSAFDHLHLEIPSKLEHVAAEGARLVEVQRNPKHVRIQKIPLVPGKNGRAVALSDSDEVLLLDELECFPDDRAADVVVLAEPGFIGKRCAGFQNAANNSFDHICRDIRVVLGAAAPTPIRAKRAEAVLRGTRLDERTIAQAADTARAESRPISNVRGSADYRREMVRVLTRRAIYQAMDMAR